MSTPMGFMHTLSRHSPTACGGIGAMVGIGAGLITDGIGAGMASTLVGVDSMSVGAVGTVPIGVGTIIMVMIGVGITITIIPVIGDRVIHIPHVALSVYAVAEELHAILQARVQQAVQRPVWQVRQDARRVLHQVG